jgi:hypothetical protein
MIKNFSKKLVGTELTIPVWSAGGQKYLVTSAHETVEDGHWKGYCVMEWKPTQYTVPHEINVVVKKYGSDLDFIIELEHPLPDSRTRNFNVIVKTEHLKSLESFTKLITNIIDDFDKKITHYK